MTATFDPISGDFVTPFNDDVVRNMSFLQRPDCGTSTDRKEEHEDSDHHEYTTKCLLWVANANAIVVRYLMKLLSNLCNGGNAELVDAVKAVLRKLIKSEDTSAVFGAMLETSDVLAFYFRLIMQQSSTHAPDDSSVV